MISKNGIGVYIAYPTTSELQFTYVNALSRVNNQHTNVGFTKDSFSRREDQYFQTFNGKIYFEPIAEISLADFHRARKAILSSIGNKFSKIGTTLQWFDSADRQAMEREIRAVLAAL